jgi:hypothetical protein
MEIFLTSLRSMTKNKNLDIDFEVQRCLAWALTSTTAGETPALSKFSSVVHLSCELFSSLILRL